MMTSQIDIKLSKSCMNSMKNFIILHSIICFNHMQIFHISNLTAYEEYSNIIIYETNFQIFRPVRNEF